MQSPWCDILGGNAWNIAGSKFTPDYYGVEVAWAWEIWPWNFYEDLNSLITKIFESEKMKEFSTMELKKHLREYNNIVVSDDQLSKIKAYMGFLGVIVYPLDKAWKLKE